MRDYRKLKVKDIRNILIDEHGSDKDSIFDIKGKVNLVKLLKKYDNDSVNLDNIKFPDKDYEQSSFTPVIENDEDSDTDIDNTPSRTDPEWSNYVLNQFSADELFDNKPTVNGLRRVAELLIGEINYIRSTVEQVPNKENGGRSTIKATIGFMNGDIYDGVSDAWDGNTDEPYSKHPTSYAETRAEGRALRRALRLKTVAAEELAINVINDENSPINITDTQITYIDVLTKRININVKKFLTYQKLTCNNIMEVKHEEALMLIEALSEFQRNLESIPEDILEYDPNWQSS